MYIYAFFQIYGNSYLWNFLFLHFSYSSSFYINIFQSLTDPNLILKIKVYK